MTFGMITPTVAIIILIIALIIFGPGKLPDIGKGLGKGIKEFRTATSFEEDNNKKENHSEDNDKKSEEKKETT